MSRYRSEHSKLARLWVQDWSQRVGTFFGTLGLRKRRLSYF